MTWKNWLLLIALALVWGATFPFGKIALMEIPPFVLAFLRVLLAALVLHALLAMRGLVFPRDLSTLGAFLVMWLLNNAIPFLLILWGQTGISASLASILNATTPIFTVLVASVLFRQEILRAHRIAGIAVGFAGVALLLLPGLEAGALASLSGEPVWGQVLCLGAALSYAFAAAFARRFRRIPIMVAATGQLTGSSLLLLPLALWQAISVPGGWTPGMAGPATWASVVALGTACTALAYLIYFRLLGEAGATNASLVTLLIPVSAVLISASLLGEALSVLQMAGMAVLFLGLLLLDGRVLALSGRSRHRARRRP